LAESDKAVFFTPGILVIISFFFLFCFTAIRSGTVVYKLGWYSRTGKGVLGVCVTDRGDEAKLISEAVSEKEVRFVESVRAVVPLRSVLVRWAGGRDMSGRVTVLVSS
jgi:hypothetical protein